MSRWQAQPQAVRGLFPVNFFNFLRMPQEVHLPWIGRIIPLCFPLTVLFSPSRIWIQRAVGSVSSSLCLSCLGLGSIWGIRWETNFQKTLSSSSSICHLWSNLRQAKKVSTKVRPKISSWILVCQRFVFHVECSYCLSDQGLSSHFVLFWTIISGKSKRLLTSVRKNHVFYR